MKVNFLIRAIALSNAAVQALSTVERAPGIWTTSGIVTGHAAANRTGVTEYLGIPYAAATSGSRRWMPPQRYKSTKSFDAATYGPSCPVNNVGALAFPNRTAQFERIYLAFLTQGGNVQSEDCLSANVWVKTNLESWRPKPVLVFLPGGRWNAGGAKSLFYNGQYLADAEDVIVVTINYRLNIFGFPGTPGLQQNLGLLDQRMALEWLRDNISGFGGDVDRIIVFGQSAGGVSAAYQAYVYPHDPIVAGYILISGTPHSWEPLTPELAAKHWYNASSTLGCGSSGDVLSCMQSKNMSAVLAAYAKVPFDPTNALYQPQFQPVIDNITVFPDYNSLAAAGKFAKLPVLLGNTNFESGFYQLAAFATGRAFNATQQELFNLEAFTCATSIEASARSAQVPVYRYRYFGDFPNLRLYPGSGAYHGTDLDMIFGTAEDVSGLPNSEAENKTIAYIQEAYATFARDPWGGLTKHLGWPLYSNSTASTLIRLGYNNESIASFVSPGTYDAQCPALKGAVDLGKGAF